MNDKQYEAAIERDYIILYRLYHTPLWLVDGPGGVELISERLKALEQVLGANRLAMLFAGIWCVSEIPMQLSEAGLITYAESERLIEALPDDCDDDCDDDLAKADSILRPLMQRLFWVWRTPKNTIPIK